MKNMKQVKRASRRAGFLTIAGFIIVTASLIYSSVQLSELENTIEIKKIKINNQNQEIENLRREIKDLRKLEIEYRNQIQYLKEEEANIKQQVMDLDSTQQSLLDFLVSVTDPRNISILGYDIDWGEVKRQVDGLPSGRRKNAILNAILLAWKDIPFVMNKEDVRAGFDSPRFLRYVLRTVGIDVKTNPGEPLSVTLMSRFNKVDNPIPGDIAFFKGQVGNFGFILAAVGASDSDHVGIGTVQEAEPLQIVSMRNVNILNFPLKGYYRVRYPDEN